MPKQKTHGGLKKRFWKTKNGKKSGKWKRGKSCRNHLIKNKSKGSQKLGSNGGLLVDQSNVKRLDRLAA